MEKDLSKLRPFNPEEAKAGGLMCDVSRVGGAYTYIAGPDAGGWIATENEKGMFIFSAQTNLFMLPLCWVEGEPVYPDTPMERADNGWPVKFDKAGNDWQDESGNWSADGLGFAIRWPYPKPVKRWLNVYAGTYAAGADANLYLSERIAEQFAGLRRLACIEIELPPPPAEVKP